MSGSLPQASSGFSERSRAIDILRAFAVIGTIFQHTYFPYTNSQEWVVHVGGSEFYPFIFANGWLGVNLFFILSGFVFYRPALATDRASITRYYGQRAWRLWPLLMLFGFVAVLNQTGNAYTALGYAVLYCTGINNLIPTLWMPSLAVLWSIGVEILFSLVLPWLLRLLRIKFDRVCIVIIVFCFLYRIVGDACWSSFYPGLGNRTINPLKDNLFGRLDDFVVGMMAARLCFRPDLVISRKLTVFALIGMGLTLYGWNWVWANPRNIAVSILVSFLHTSFSLSALVLICRFYVSPIARWAGLYPMVVIGQMCYSIYFVHHFLLKYSKGAIDLLSPWGALEFLLLTFVVSAFCFIAIEARGIHRKPHWLVGMERKLGLNY